MESETTRPDAPPRTRRLWLESLVLLVVALVVAVLVKALLVQAFFIPSESMEPGLVKHDRIAVQKVSYWFGGSPRRGDVIVFEDPGDWLDAADDAGPTTLLARAMTRIGLYPSGGHLVKRVIGVAGDTIVCCDAQGRISVDGVPLDEDGYIAPQTGCDGPEIPGCHWSAGPVPAGHLFVLGDNRAHSWDSAAHQCAAGAAGCDPGDEYVATDLVVGKVLARVWPLGRIGFLHRPATFDRVTGG